MSLDKKLFDIAKSAIDKQQKTRDSRNAVSKGFDIATNKSYANDDQQVASAALRNWENKVWKPKVEAKLKREMKARVSHLKPGTDAYNKTYNDLFNRNYKQLQDAKAKAQQQLGTLRGPKQTQRQLDNEYRAAEAARNNATGTQALAHTVRDTGEAVLGALATGSTRALRYPLQFAADIGDNDDGSIFDRGAKALERHEDRLKDVYPAYADMQQNGSFSQKLGIAAVEQLPNLVLSATGAGAAAKGAQLAGAGTKMTAATAYGSAAAISYPQAYGDGNDSTKDELAPVSALQLARAPRSKDIFKKHYEKNVKAGLSEDDAFSKARDQTVSSIAEQAGDTVGVATLGLSMIAPGVGSFTANRVAGGAVTKWGQKAFNKLAAKADTGRVAKYAIPTGVGATVAGLNFTEEFLQEGFTDYTAQSAAVDVGVRNKVDYEQTKEAALMGGILGAAFGGGTFIATRNSKLHQAQDQLKQAQQAYAETAEQIPQLREQIETVSPRSPEGQALTQQLEQIQTELAEQVAAAEKAGVPSASLTRRAPRIEPTNSSTDFDGSIDGATEIDGQSFEDMLNAQGEQAPVVSEQELDEQDTRIAELIAEQAALDEAIADGSNDVPLEESIAKAQSWYDQQRGEGQEGLGGVVRRAAASEQDAAFNEQQQASKNTTVSINDYIAGERAKQAQIDEQVERLAAAASTEAEKAAAAAKILQREQQKAVEDEVLSTREQLAQPYEGETFDTTVTGADGAPFNLARFWDTTMPAAAKARVVREAGGSNLFENLIHAEWSLLPEGVQKAFHKWFSDNLEQVRQKRAAESQQPQETEQNEPPQGVGLTMPGQPKAADVYTTDNLKADIASNYESNPQGMFEASKRAEAAGIPKPEINKVILETLSEQVGWTQPNAPQQAPIELNDQNPIVNIPAPTSGKTETPAPTKTETASTDEGIYKSKPAARAAIKKQKLDPKLFDIVQTDEGFELVERTEPRNNDVTGDDGQPKWFGSDAKAQEHISKKKLSDNYRVVQNGKHFEIQPKQAEAPTPKKSTGKNITDEQFAELTSSRTTPSTLPGEPTTKAKVKAKVTGQEGWQGNLAKSRNFARQLYEAGHLSQTELQTAFEGGADTLTSAVNTGIKRQDAASRQQRTKNNVKHNDAAIQNTFGMSIDDIADVAYKSADELEAKAKQSKNKADQDAADTAKRQMNQDFFDIEDDVTAYARGEMSLPDFLDSKAGKLPALVEAVTQGKGTQGTGNSVNYQELAKQKTAEQAAIRKAAIDKARKEQAEKAQAESAPKTAPKTAPKKAGKKTAAELRASLLDNNKLVSKEQAEKHKQTLRSRLGQANTGFDIEAFVAASGLAVAYIEGGIRNFADFATLVVDDVGVKVQKYLLPAWEGARAYDDLDTEGMTSTEDARAEYEQLVADGFFDDVQETEQPAAAESKHPKTLGTGDDIDTFVGENKDGKPLYEDKNGVRGIYESGIMDREPVAITPTGLERTERRDRYLTKDELAARENTDDTSARGIAEPQDGGKNQSGETPVRDGRGNAQQGATPADSTDLGDAQPENDQALESDEGDGRPGVRGTGENVADAGPVPSQRTTTDGREGTSGEGAPNAGTRSRTDADVKSPAATKAQATDLLIDNPLEIVGGTPVQRFNKNRAALELLEQLEVEGRQATTDEQKVLAGYIGWGSFGQELFQGSWEHPKYKDEGVWQERGEWLRETMGESAWKSAQRSITNAHYTDPPTVLAMWDMLKRMGFKGGRVLEPSMGTGNFFSMMPANIKSRSQLTGIELDETTGAIAKQLFPQSNIQVMGYQDSKTPDDFYDVVIGNYPFENTPVADRRYNKLNPMLHDYFFLKSIDQVRPGGIVMSITSSGTMDKQNTMIRRELAKKAELISAIRLPSGAFKDYAGTSVVTDILIFRKRPERLEIVPEDATWVDIADYKTPSGETIKVNKFYLENPNNIIGTLDYGTGTTMFGPGMIVRRPNEMAGRLKDAVSFVPEDAIKPAAVVDHLTYYANETGERHGSLFQDKDGRLMLTRGDQAIDAQEIVSYEVQSKKTTEQRRAELTDAIDLRRKHSALVDAERAGQDATTERRALKDAYQAFTKAHGSLRDSYALKYMNRVNDPFYYELAALENDDGTPATVMDKSTTRGKVTMENPSIRDAYVLARNQSVNPSVQEIAELTGKPESEVKAELKDSGAVFEAPNGDLVPSDIYLSGNVRQKLREAQAAFDNGNDAMKDNVAALQNVVPEDVPYFNIETKLGATWVPQEVYQEYIASMLGLDSTDGIEVSFTAGRWKVRLDKRMNGRSEASTNYGTPHYKFSGLMQAAISNQTVRINKTVEGQTMYDHAASTEVNARIGKIREDFGTWLWSDPERRVDLEREYNESRNAWATPKYDGSFLTFEGMALSLGRGEFNLREHQANAIWRAIVNRRSLNAHEVGTGKTFTMGGIAIESRRYGIAKKPVIFAHNANSAAVADEIRMMYPSARVLYIDNLQPKNREIRLRQIANDDWDAIVLPHSLIDRLALTEDTLMRMAADDIAALEQEFREAAKDDGENVSRINLDDDESIAKIRSVTAKELAKARKRIIESIKKQAQQATKPGAVTFEDLGIDMILVDEVHEFKKPPIVTRMKMKGLNTQVSQRSIQLQFLTRYVRQMNNGGNVHTFTGTPITNTITEIYHQMRYVMDSEMETANVSDWDGWFGSFATELQDVELTDAGDYEMVTRLAGFINVPELRQMVGQYMDTVFAEDMPEMQPRKTESGKTMADDLTEAERAQLLNGRTEGAKDRPYKKVINDTADMTEEQEEVFRYVQGLAQEWRDADGKARREWSKSGDERAPLIYGRIANKASFDVRVLDEKMVGMEGKSQDNPNSKASRAIKNVKEIYDSHPLASQVIFMEEGYNKTATRSQGRDEAGEKLPDITVPVFAPVIDMVERLVQSGIPREQIAVVSGKTSKAKRSEIAAGMNDGTIRVVIGSTQTLGVGVNMQRNLRAMHHMDAPFMPGELEQRNGRGQRQGNQWNTVLEYRYMTDRLDGKRWQILAVKQRFITAFMKANGDTRTIEGDAAAEEQSDILESFSEAAGDPRVLQRVKLQKKQDSLKNKERIYTRGITDMKREIRRQQARIEKGQEKLASIQPEVVANTLQAQRDGFKAVIDGKSFDKRADAIDAANKFIDANVRMDTHKPINIGTYAGIPLKAVWDNFDTEPKVIMEVGGHKFAGKGIGGLEAVMRNFPKTVENTQNGIDAAERAISNLEKALQQPFGQATDLERTAKQLADLEKDLELNPVPPPSWLRQGAPMDSEVYYNKQPFVVTGHRYDKNGWFVIAEDSKGQVAIPYLEAKDAAAMPLYDEKSFTPPEVITKANKGLTDADRVPGSDDKPQLSRKADDTTTTTPKQVIDVLTKRFGKDTVAKLIKAGVLRVRSLSDFTDSNGNTSIPSDAEGFYYDGKVTLIADNLDADTIIPTFLHELGGHGGIETLMSDADYMQLMEGFNKLVENGNPLAVRAKERADNLTSSQDEALSEYIPYLITEHARTNERGGPIGAVKRFVNRVVAAIRAWARSKGVKVSISPNDIAQLAERAIQVRADMAANESNITIPGVRNETVYSRRRYDNENQLALDFDAVDDNVAPKNQPELEATILDDTAREQWRAANKFGKRQDRDDDVQEAAQKYKDGGMEQEDYIKIVREKMPIKPMDSVPKIPTLLEIGFALNKNKAETGIIGVNKTIADGERVALRLDIPAYNDYDTWVVSIHDGTKKNGKSIAYAQTGYISDVEFATVPLAALNIAAGSSKATIARMHGDWINHSPEALAKKAEAALASDEWIEVGMNPFRHSWFYDKADGNPVVSADEVIQIGAMVLARGVKKTDVTDPQFDTGPKGNNVKFSRRYSNATQGTPARTRRQKAMGVVGLGAAAAMSAKVGVNLLLRRHLATPQHVALLNPSFKTFTDNVQHRIAYENNEAGNIQQILPEIWDTRLVTGKKKKALEKVSTAIFDGTMADTVWSDTELEQRFNLDADEVNFYKRSRAAINKSLRHLVQDTLSALSKGTKLIDIDTINRLKARNLHPLVHMNELRTHMINELQRLAQAGSITPRAEARLQQQLTDLFEVMGNIANKHDHLVNNGYAPLMRFGHYAVEVRDKINGNLDLFELYESEFAQRRALRDLKKKYDSTQYAVGKGTLNPDAFKQFTDKGLSPETVQLFASELGLDNNGAYQAYLKVAVSNRSALKRLIQRKKVPGYSEDMSRVLSAFVMSNARYSGRMLYNGEIENAIQKIKDGNLQGEAQKVFDNMENPQEEFAQQRSLMFLYFMGLSPAFFVLNMTQPFTQTIPKLTAYVGGTKAHSYMTQALYQVGKYAGKATAEAGKRAVGKGSLNWRGFEDNLPSWVNRDDYLRMSKEGHLDPQNIFMIKGLERGKRGVASGLWGGFEAFAGIPAEVSESINRRATMIAAFKAADDMGAAVLRQKGFDNAYDFAVSVIQQTQGIYNKGNRSGLARGNGKLGHYGPLVMVFKQFTINYTEQMIRHAKDGEVKALATAMIWQFMLAGMLGLPFADDLLDIAEGLIYRVFGKATNFVTFLQETLGEKNANALMYGFPSEYARVDFHGRSSLGNLIPGTDVARPGPTDWKEVLGASSGFYESFFLAAGMATEGRFKDAAIQASPRFVRDAAAGIEIARTGEYRNPKGQKIMELDGVDAALKGLGQFNPSNNAKPGRRRSNAYNMKNMVKDATDGFSLDLAEAIYADDYERIDEVYDAMDAWNERNAEWANVDIEKIEKSADKRVEGKDFDSGDRQKLPDNLASYLDELDGT